MRGPSYAHSPLIQSSAQPRKHAYTCVCALQRRRAYIYVYDWLTACTHLHTRARRSSHLTDLSARSESEITPHIRRVLRGSL